jgi:serine/threonine/tyrosine-interacting protein
MFYRYEMRRECQEILPGLLLGPFQASKSLDILQKLSITHMCVSWGVTSTFICEIIILFRVCIRDLKEAFSVKPRFPDLFSYLVLDVQDNEEQNLIRVFPQLVIHILSLR